MAAVHEALSLNEKYFLVACKPGPDALWGIYLVDIFDNLTLITEQEGEGLTAPIPLKKRKHLLSSRRKSNRKKKRLPYLYRTSMKVKARKASRGEQSNRSASSPTNMPISSPLPTMMHRVFRADGILNVFSVPYLSKKTVPSCSRYRPTHLSLSSRWIKRGRYPMDAKLADRYARRDCLLYGLP